MPDTVLGIGDTAMNKRDKNLMALKHKQASKQILRGKSDPHALSKV